jgi:predicted thioesterase
MPLHAFKTGDTIEATQVVDANRVASHLGSGSLQVYATPAMVIFIEHTCRQLIEPHLPKEQTSVGVSIAVKHLAPTPVGATVSIRAEIVDIDERLVKFKARIYDETEQIGEAEHDRAVIEVERFLRRVAGKSKTQGSA